MNISIRKFLLLNLLLAVTITTTITVIGNYYLDQRDIQQHLDSFLLQASLAFKALIITKFDDQSIHNIQHALNKIPKEAQTIFQNKKSTTNHQHYRDTFEFQVWSLSKQPKLLLKSANAPMTRLATPKAGFSDDFVNHRQWRTFTVNEPAQKLSFTVAERYDIRNALVRHLAIDEFYIMLWTYPISGVLIWFIIGRGLESIRRVAKEVANRDPNNLEAVNANNVPVEIKPLVDDLNNLFLRLQQAIEREKRFAADAAHELRTPLAALRAQAQVALRSTNTEERQKTLQNVIACVDRSTHVVQQLLTLSRLVPEASSINDSLPMNLYSLAAEIIAQLAPTALEKDIEIELIGNEDTCVVKANVTALSILLRNLTDNAIRYTPQGGKVKVTLQNEPHEVLLIVTDNGPGIPAELRNRVFERFYRVLGNTSTGSGLGLAIVQQIAKLHHASLRLGTPRDGKGLEVIVNFPK